jgi:drug/metabolite transporter (DMT)-like permease
MIGFGEFASVACAFCWALSVVMIKRVGDDVPAFALNLLKCSVALLLLIPTLLLIEGPRWPNLSGAQVMMLMASGLIGIGIADTLYFSALKALGATRTAIIGNLFSPFVIALSFVFLDERMNLIQGLGFVLVMAGVVLVNGVPDADGRPVRALARGIALGCLSIALMAIAIVMVKRLLETESFLWVTTLRVFAGWLGLVVIFGLRGELLALRTLPWRTFHWPMLIGASVLGTYLSLMLWLAGYKYTDASIASVLNESASVFIVLLAWAWLKEPIGGRQVIGMIVTAMGIGLMVVR